MVPCPNMCNMQTPELHYVIEVCSMLQEALATEVRLRSGLVSLVNRAQLKCPEVNSLS